MFERIGGYAVIEKLVDDFYQIMSTDPKARECYATHAGRDIKDSAHKLKFFLSGWLGGPQLYVENFGHPRLRMRHFPFAIGEKEAEQWLYCMDMAMDKNHIDRELKAQIMEAFRGVTTVIKNRG